MITIGDLLLHDHISLEVQARQSKEAIDEVAALVKTSPEVLDWDALLKGVHASAPCLPEPEAALRSAFRILVGNA